MESHEEKRSHQRYEYNSPMDLYRMDHQDQNYYAEMNDYSESGLSVMTNEKLVIGQLVYLEMKNRDDSATGPEKHKSYSGIVKWASPNASLNGSSKGPYKYGVEYSGSNRYQC